MRTLCLASAKGGSGKSTLSIALAVEAMRRGEHVALIDCDPQGSADSWHEKRGSPDNPTLIDNPVSLAREIRKLENDGYTLAVIDTPPEILRTIHAAMRAADLVLIPVKPSFMDITAVRMVIELAAKDNKPFVFVVNEAPARGARTEQTADILSVAGDVLGTIVKSRNAYVTAIAEGLAGNETDPLAREEIANLWKEVAALLPKVRT